VSGLEQLCQYTKEKEKTGATGAVLQGLEGVATDGGKREGAAVYLDRKIRTAGRDEMMHPNRGECLQKSSYYKEGRSNHWR